MRISLERARDAVEFRDFDDLLPLPTLSEKIIDEMRRIEFGEPSNSLDGVYWAELYRLLADSGEFLQAVRDDGFAAGVYRFFTNSELVRKTDGKRLLLGSDRRYGDMLGALRRVGERYNDFYSYTGFEYGHRLASDDDLPRIRRLFEQAGFIHQAND